MDNGGAFTDRLLDSVPFQPGWACLDVGCGSGDVTVRLAARSGPTGHVIGIDPDPKAVDKARERGRDLATVEFREDGVLDLPDAFEGCFDLVTCRRVLMYLPDPVAALRAMRRVLRPGGRVVLQEHDAGLRRGLDGLPLNGRAQDLVWDTVRAEGADTAIGLKLDGYLREAGFAAPDITAEAIVQTPDSPSSTAQIVQLMAERIVASGTATRAELDALDLPTLDARLEAEGRAVGTSLIAETIFGAVAVSF